MKRHTKTCVYVCCCCCSFVPRTGTHGKVRGEIANLDGNQVRRKLRPSPATSGRSATAIIQIAITDLCIDILAGVQTSGMSGDVGMRVSARQNRSHRDSTAKTTLRGLYTCAQAPKPDAAWSKIQDKERYASDEGEPPGHVAIIPRRTAIRTSKAEASDAHSKGNTEAGAVRCARNDGPVAWSPYKTDHPDTQALRKDSQRRSPSRKHRSPRAAQPARVATGHEHT